MQIEQSCCDSIPQIQEILTEQKFTVSMIDTACGYSFCHKNEIIICKTDVFSMSKFSASSSLHKNELKSKPLPYFREIQKIRKLYKDHKLDEAYESLNQIFKEFFKSSQFKNFEAAKNSFYQNSGFSESDIEFLRLIEEQFNDLKNFDKQLEMSGWIEKSNKKGMKISTKRGSDNVGVLVECVLSVPIQIFLTVLTEIDLMKQFIPFMEQSQLVKVPSRNCRIGYSMNNFPILSKRQALFDGIGYDRLDHNSSIFLYTRSIHNRPDLLKRYELNFQQKKNTVMIEYKYLILEYTPIDRQKGYLKFAANTDMKVSVPMFLLQMATEGFGYDLVSNILKVSQKFKGSAWETKMRQNPDFFRFIQQRQDQYWREKERKNVNGHA